jgi:hypothetical protein
VAAGVCSTVFFLRHSPEAVAAAGSGLEGRALINRSGLPGGAVPVGAGALGGDGADASRRRERGAKALEERLTAGKAAAEAPGAAPDDMESGAAA